MKKTLTAVAISMTFFTAHVFAETTSQQIQEQTQQLKNSASETTEQAKDRSAEIANKTKHRLQEKMSRQSTS